MKPKLYLETSIVGYLTSRPSRDIVVAGHQQVTREWWQARREHFDLFTSRAVLAEVSAGDPTAATERLEALQGVPLLTASQDVDELAEALIRYVPLPEKAAIDAVHIALSVVNGVDYLLTWNCKHIANAALRGRIEDACEQLGYLVPVICTPLEIME